MKGENWQIPTGREVQFTKLPKWTQGFIRRLQRQLDDAAETLDALEGTQQPSIIKYSSGDRKIYVPKTAAVQLSLDGVVRDRPRNYLTVRYPSGGGSLNHWEDFSVVEISGQGMGEFAIHPITGNVVRVGMAPRKR